MKIPEVLLIEVHHSAGSLAQVLQVVGQAGLLVTGLDAVHRGPHTTTWELSVDIDEDHPVDIGKRIDILDVALVVGSSDRVFDLHRGGKIRTLPTRPIEGPRMLRDIYTPGVARVCRAIQAEPDTAREFTNIGRTVAIVTNGTAILGLGNIGALAGLPVMEGKAALFSMLAGISGVPILIESEDPDVIVETVVNIAPSFGAIQLEDIAAPACFEIEERLAARLDRPVLHDDQHGTAVVVLAALLSAARQSGHRLEDVVVGQIGLGAAGLGIARLLRGHGVGGHLGADRSEGALRRFEESGGQRASLEELMARADVVLATTGVRDLIPEELVRKGQLILALGNPEPEIEPQKALDRGAAFAAEGSSVNNVLGFPGLFRGALDARAKRITPAMLVAAARTLSNFARPGDLVPDALDLAVHESVAEEVKAAALAEMAKLG